MARKKRRARPKNGRQKPPDRPAVAAATATAQRRSRWELALLACVLLWAFLLGCTTLRVFDIWWHLKTGELILERGTLPQTDWFTFVDWGKPWIDLHWGFQLLAVGLYRLGGTELLVLAKAGCLAATVVVAWLAAGRRLPTWLGVACWIPPIICMSARSVVRPEMLTLLFLAISLYLVSRIDRYPRLVWCLPLLQVVWINCHALFVLGLMVAAAFVADRIVREAAGGRCGLAPVDSLLSTNQLMRASVLIVLAALVNPYFEEGALFPLVLYRKFSVDQALYMGIGEFQPPFEIIRENGIWHVYSVCSLGLGLLTFGSFAWLARHRRLNPMRIILFVAFGHLALQAWRNISMFGLVAGFTLCANLIDVLELRRHRLQAEQGKRPISSSSAAAGESRSARSRDRVPTLVVGSLVVFLLVVMPAGYWNQWTKDGRRFGIGEDQEIYRYAHGAAKFAGQPGFPNRAFVVHLGQAAVYIFHNAPQRRVFMDGRLEVATRETYQQYLQFCRLMSFRPGQTLPTDAWAEQLRDQDGNLPVVILDSRLARPQIEGLLRLPRWRLVFADPAAAVFLDVAQAERLNLPTADDQPLHYPPDTTPKRTR